MSAHRLRPSVGLLLNQEEVPGEPMARWSEIRELARAAEAEGIDSLWVVDHFLWQNDPWRRADAKVGVWECWTTLAALAAATEKSTLGTLVTCTAYRNPALLAKMADAVDEISGGRLILGLGAGDYPEEHAMFGYPTDRPVSRFEEALNIIVPLLRTGRVDYDGDFYAARECELRPRGPRATGPPIMIGALAHRPRMLRLVAEHADIWNSWVTHRDPVTAVRELRDAVDAACVEHGRERATLRRSLTVAVALDGPISTREGPFTGNEEQIADRFRELWREGIEHIQVVMFPTDRDGVAFLGRVIQRLGDADDARRTV